MKYKDGDALYIPVTIVSAKENMYFLDDDLAYSSTWVDNHAIEKKTIEGLEARIAELEARLNPPSCGNCKHKIVDENLFEPCYSCRSLCNWEAAE